MKPIVTALAHCLGKIAIRLGRKLAFNPDTQRFVDDEAANRLINQPMRAPWHI